MKTKILGIVIIAMLVVLALAGAVNAASVTASPSKVEKGETVTVTIKTSKPVTSAGFTLSYDKSTMKCTEKSTISKAIRENETGLKCGIMATEDEATDTITLTFEALKTGKVNFQIGGDMLFETAEGEQIDKTFAKPADGATVIETVNVKIGDKTYKLEKGAKLNTIEGLAGLKVQSGKTFVNFTTADGKVVNDNDAINCDMVLTANFKTNDAPVVSKPEDNDPVVSKPEDKDPVVSKPEDKDPVVSKPEDNDPITSKPEDKDPVASKPEDNDPVTSKPDDVKDPVTSEPEGDKTENNGEYLDDNGKPIKEIVQAGSLVPAIVFGIIMVAVISIASIKVMKINK